jgi:plastocyanin
MTLRSSITTAMRGGTVMSNTDGDSAKDGCPLLSTRTLLYGAALFVAVALIFTPSGRHLATASQTPVTIKMLDMPPAFAPVTVTIKAGETVQWVNVGNEVHHATSDPSMAIKSSEVGNPSGAEPFDSGFMKPGESFMHTFKVPGVYKYACAVHETKGMLGEIVVK